MTQVNIVITKLQKSASQSINSIYVFKKQKPNIIHKWGGDFNLVLNLEIEHLSQLAINKVIYRWN